MKANQLKNVIKMALGMGLFLIIMSCNNYTPKNEENISLSEVELNEDFESISNERTSKVLTQDASTSAIPENLKIIKSAKAKYKVINVNLATQQIKAVAFEFGGYISDLRFENNLYKKENRFTIKIPQQHFDSVMDSISRFAEFVDYENITTNDVTEEYIDIETRLKTKLEVKTRYESILRKDAITVEDILATEDKLRVIQEEIEAAQGRLKYLTSKVSFSTIQIDLYETVDYKDEPVSYHITFWTKLKNAVTFGWDFIESLFIGIIHVWPLIIIGVLGVIFFRRKNKRQ